MTDKNKEFEKIKKDRLMQWILGILTTYPNSYSVGNVPIDEMIKECEDIGKSEVKSGLEMYGIHYDFKIILTRDDNVKYADEPLNPEYTS